MELTRQYPRVFLLTGEKAVIAFVFGLFFISGFAALLYQVIWQRVLAIFSGADVYSVTIIVAAFMAGLGCGSLAGGYLADRLPVGRRVALFAAAEGSIALFALVSKWLYYDFLYLQHNDLARSPFVLAAVLFVSLLWPTFFMGMSLPLLARTLTRSVEGAARMVGALYGFNTLGAATGAFLTAWFFTRSLGFEITVYLGALLNALCAAGALLISPYFLRNNATLIEESAAPTPDPRPPTPVTHSTLFPVPIWILIYSLSGFIALSLEIVWFRLLGVMLKSTAFTFGSLLAIFLMGLAVGTFRGIGWAQRSRDPARVVFLLQAGVALYAGISILFLALALNNFAFMDPLWAYLGGYDTIDIEKSVNALGQFLSNPAIYSPDVEKRALDFLMLYLLLPLALVGPPTLMMGLSFPFLQRVVQSDVAYLGRRVGWLQTANIFGSMLGAILTGWVLLRFLGTSLTVKALLCIGSIFLILLIARRVEPGIKRVGGLGAALAVVLLIAWLIPGSDFLWAKLHGTTPERAISAEDGSGLSLLKGQDAAFGGDTIVYANGLGQSSVPFPGHHITLGLVPAMLHPKPEDIAIIGLGSGATLFAAGGHEETQRIECIEIIAPQLDTLKSFYAKQPYGGVKSVLEDPRIRYTFTDGRAFIMLGDRQYDIIEADALRPNSAYAGNLYSVEYFTLLKDHLKPGGFAVTWSPTRRVQSTFLKVFPHAMLYQGDVTLLIGSNEPFDWDGEAIVKRLGSPFTKEYYARAGVDVGNYIETLRDSKPDIYTPEYNRSGLMDVNTDLYPKDEYLVP